MLCSRVRAAMGVPLSSLFVQGQPEPVLSNLSWQGSARAAGPLSSQPSHHSQQTLDQLQGLHPGDLPCFLRLRDCLLPLRPHGLLCAAGELNLRWLLVVCGAGMQIEQMVEGNKWPLRPFKGISPGI